MSGKSMDVFSLRDSIVSEYRKFATSFTTIHAEDIRAQVEAIYSEGRFWPDPLLQLNPSYKHGANIATLIAGGALDPRTHRCHRELSPGARSRTYLRCTGSFVVPSSSRKHCRTSYFTPSRSRPQPCQEPPRPNVSWSSASGRTSSARGSWTFGKVAAP